MMYPTPELDRLLAEAREDLLRVLEAVLRLPLSSAVPGILMLRAAHETVRDLTEERVRHRLWGPAPGGDHG